MSALLAGLGQGWVRSGPEDAWRSEPGLVVSVGLSVDEAGHGKVRMEVRPMVGWAWYIAPILVPVLAVQAGSTLPMAFGVGLLVVGATRVFVARFVMRPRVVARRTSLQAEIAQAMAALGGTPSEA